MQNHQTIDTELNESLDWVAWLRNQRRRTIDFLLRLILFIGFFGLVYVLILGVRAQRITFNAGYYLVTYLLVWWLYFTRRLDDSLRALAVLLVTYGFAVLSLYVGWLAGSGRLFLLVLIPLSGILLSPKAGIYAAVLVLFTYAFFGLAFNREWFELGLLPDPTEPSPVFVEGVGFAICIALVIASQWFLAQALNAANEAKNQAEEARQQAVKSERVKTQFLANVSHELRTPLNAVINFTQFVSSGLYGSINPPQKDALTKSTDSARHLLALINDILDMSKIEAGHLQLNIEADIDLRAELAAVAAATRALLVDKPVEVLEEVEPDLPAVVGDRRRIRQTLLNLASNAVKFTGQGYIWLRARRDGDQVVFEVEDTGSGIVLEEQTRIFEPFHQANDATSAGGTGLGLSIARHLVEAQGGKIWLTSQVGEGSIFCFSHPIKSAELVALMEADNEEAV